ncbi:YggS family pyridoxal phosphate-dependent enzyme [Clostridium sp.]|uniref:YggS family pyridoxal phosphate-dependent enzyme n=1 Tax=Clostridium sp. TaxID=1506 RepID=UPI003991FF2E
MDINENIAKTLKTIKEGVTLIAVSKTKPIEMLEEAYKTGIRDFGENKVQELCEKYDEFHKDVRWHLLGHLQRNKVKYIVGKVNLIHSVDSIELIREIEKRYKKENLIADILIQINIGRETQKYGVLEENIYDIMEEVKSCDNVKVKGLMAIIPKGNKEENKAYFDKMYNIFKELKNKQFNNVSMDILSMGMTHDYLEAIEAGSNMVRIGEGIFGKRDYSKLS